MPRFRSLRDRYLPAVLMTAGVALLAGGFVALDDETLGAELVASPTPAIPTLAPSPSAAESSPTPTTAGSRVATRVVIASLGIDLPIVRPPGGPDTYPLCDVAEFIQELGQPGEGRASYIYAHAREGMFLPLLESSRRNGGRAMLGSLVEVYTSDDRLFLYEITEVRPHQLTLSDAANADREQLWLQTSEGPPGTKPKLQVVAEYLSDGPADHAAAHPKPKPRVCG